LKCLHNSQNIGNKYLSEVKNYSINKISNILNIYGISQNPYTKDYIIVLQYATGGNFNHWINKNYDCFDWGNRLTVLLDIINGLKEIHQKNLVHHDFHTGNILFLSKIYNFGNCISISDMGLCGEADNVDDTRIYGVMPYMAPELFRRNPYTQAADIYSFGMIMYFVATGREPFNNRAHDASLVIDICEGFRPAINELEVPKCYINLMKRCWDPNPSNRPNVLKVNELIISFCKSYVMGFFIVENEKIEIQFKKAEEYRIVNLSLLKNNQVTTHLQAIYTSRILSYYSYYIIDDFDDFMI
ncbi:kinase-like domain-containing protein, partial [Rhizophagus diaphanus]